MKNFIIYPYKKTVRVFLCFIMLLSGQVSAATFYVVRHAEKLSGDDPELSVKGQQRAQRLANLLSTADIQIIYSTNYRRTQATAKPIAEVKNLTVITYDPSDLEGFAKHLLSADKNAVIVGHSNTTPNLVRLLSQQTIAAMDEDTFHLIYQVVTGFGAKASKAVVNVLSSQ